MAEQQCPISPLTKEFQLYSDKKADFADCLIVIRNKDHGSETNYTFDRKAAKLSGFRLICRKRGV